ncbi:hypothetical protein K466DRAFT_666480 [Polyporus arcularius HHB13444]|uniref:F-box domain-containing protein n=1 Tax=Polyporus arcularius HHB13444 TaxID=1314778 RepID=A0A5C3NYQ6_9APHY|nr:hypothetical protein K466DRAFT_666480 [Polyporus arcularius HHB13444]
MSYEGAKCMLSRTVDLHYTSDFLSFGQFMLRDRAVRLPLLQRLVIRCRYIPGEASIGLLLTVLPLAFNLYHLEVIPLENASPSVIREMSSAIVSLTSLRHLELGATERNLANIYHVLSNIRSPLLSVVVLLPLLGETPRRGVMYSRRRDPIFLLSHMKATLEQIEVGGLATFGSYTCQYLRVKKFTHPTYEQSTTIMKPIISSFPNLHTLQIGIRATHARPSLSPNEDIRELRHASKNTIQQCHDLNKRDQIMHGRWSKLDSFTGTIIDAYATGLSCHVATAHLYSTGGKREAELMMLSTILTDWQPTFLRLALKVHDPAGHIRIFSSSVSWPKSLATLELRVSIVKEEFYFDEYFNCIGRVLATTSISALRLEVRCANTSWNKDETQRGPGAWRANCQDPDWDGPDAICWTADALLQEDLPQRVRACMRSIPTLRQVTLLWARCWSTVPDRVIGIDLDNVPYSWDRPGEPSDMWERWGSYR